MNYGAKDDGRDQHADCLDEGISERLHAHAELGIQLAQQNPRGHGDKHLDPELLIPALRATGLFWFGSRRSHQ